MKKNSVPIVLASSSPRRIELLRQAGLKVLTQSPDVEEVLKRGESPRRMVSRLACEKAEAVIQKISRDYEKVIVLAADTTVVSPGGKNLGKPRNHQEAQNMLRALSGKTHTVYTGYCIWEWSRGKSPRRIVRVVKSLVTLRKLSGDLIRRYVETGEPMDKAGAYAAQGIGMAFIEKIQGSYTNVVGLPMSQLLGDLESQLGIQALT